MYEIETSRLLLRQLNSADLNDLCRIYANPEIMKYIGETKTKQQVKKYINMMLESWEKNNLGMWAIIFKSNGHFIGDGGICFLEKTPEIEVGYVLEKSYWHLGLATEVAKASLRYGFEVLSLDRIIAVADPENAASRRVMEKVGMKYEKDAFHYNTNVVLYSISKAEYRPDDSWYVLLT